MKKTTKKSPSKPAHKKAVKDLEVKPARGGTVRGGDKGPTESVSFAFTKTAVEYKP